MKIGNREVSPTLWAGIVFRLFVLTVGLWVLIERAMIGFELITFKVALLVLVLIWMGWQLYRDILKARSNAAENPPSADDQRDMASVREAVAQANERWVCTSCGELTPADYGACIYCGRPSGSMR
jgi:hypothetical protein